MVQSAVFRISEHVPLNNESRIKYIPPLIVKSAPCEYLGKQYKIYENKYPLNAMNGCKYVRYMYSYATI